MREFEKPVNLLTTGDFSEFPVWEYTNANPDDETVVRPVLNLPVHNLDGMIVGTEVSLRSGQRVWAALGNIDVDDPKCFEHFVTISIEKDGAWYMLARYHDMDYSVRGPEGLSRFLGISTDDIFPMTYDLGGLVEHSLVRGELAKFPRDVLSRSELIALSVR